VTASIKLSAVEATLVKFGGGNDIMDAVTTQGSPPIGSAGSTPSIDHGPGDCEKIPEFRDEGV
jgi:hypothetical protein